MNVTSFSSILWSLQCSSSNAYGVFAVIVATCCWMLYRYAEGSCLRSIPRVGKELTWLRLNLHEVKRDFYNNGRDILHNGYLKHKNGLFRVQTLNVERVVLSPAYIEEITKFVPEDALDMADGLRERLLSSHTNLDAVFSSSLHIDVCKVQLTRNLHLLISPIHEEASYWLGRQLPFQTEVKAYDLVVRIISATASRMLGGRSISRNEEWLETAAGYSMDVVTAAMKLRRWPAILRPLIYPWLRQAKLLQKHLNVAKRHFGPTLKERLEQKTCSAHVESSVDMVEWMTDSAQGTDRHPDVLALNMLFMALAAVHTSSTTATQVLFDLCGNREYIAEIREEVEQVVSEHGWSLPSINRMKKLDSFMKESQRLNQAVLMTFNRKVSKTIKLRDGTILPTGTYLTMPSDSVARDPEIYADPEKFDGARFYEKRMSSKNESHRHQFATVGPESLAFGQGKQACPGRFFAGAQIKVILAEILIKYDIHFPDGQKDRPKNIYRGGLVRPDPKQTIVFALRKD